MLNDQKDKLCNKSKVPNRTNQFQIQVVIERGNPWLEPIERGNPLLKHTQEMCQMGPKHFLFMKAKDSTLETKHFVIERGNPL